MKFVTSLFALVLLSLTALGSGATPVRSALTPERVQRENRLVTTIKSESRRKHLDDSLIAASVRNGPIPAERDQSARSNFPDPKKTKYPARSGAYPWHFDITATYFYIGELATQNNPTPNTASSWDSMWDDNYGGFDDPDPANRDPKTFAPKAFTPRLNPFYVALPYNDIQQGGPRPEAEKVIPWYHRDKEGKYESVCRGTWVQIWYNGRYCFAQWEDVGPFCVDDWQYVFGGERPRNRANDCAGIDISPAVRDYLGIKGGTAKVHWRFVDFSLVPGGPWARFGKDNPFVNPSLKKAVQKYERRLRTRGSVAARTQSMSGSTTYASSGYARPATGGATLRGASHSAQRTTSHKK